MQKVSRNDYFGDNDSIITIEHFPYIAKLRHRKSTGFTRIFNLKNTSEN